MLDLKLYRLALAPVLAALVACAFSLEPVPDPLDPGPITLEFDGRAALRETRAVVAAAPLRPPGSEGDVAAAELVAERFAGIRAGTVAQQAFEAEVGGGGVELRNVVLTLPGVSAETIVVLAGRDSARGEGAASSAAATGMLLELAAELGAADHDKTLVLASTGGASAGAKGALEVVRALPDADPIEAVLVISQPGAATPEPPHLVTASSGERTASIQLAETVAALLASDAEAPAEGEGALGQIARLAMPAGLGEQAPLIAGGTDAVAISAAGERPLEPEDDTIETLSVESLTRFGQASLTTIAALDAAPAAPRHGPRTYLRFGDNLVPGWAVALLAIALLVAPAAVAASRLARAGRRQGTAGAALGWAASAALPPIAALTGVYGLALVGLLPRPDFPFDPGTIRIGFWEVVALGLVLAIALAAWRFAGPGRPPAGVERGTLAAAAGAPAVAGCLIAWLANPFLALLAAPLAHAFVLRGLRRRLPSVLVVAGTVAAALPLLAAAAHVGGVLGWGSSAPWQLVVLVADGQIGLVPALATAVLAGSVIALILARGGDGDPGRSPVRPPAAA